MSDVLELGKKRAEELKIRRYQFEVQSPYNSDLVGYYFAEDIHRLLGAGEEIFGFQTNGVWYREESRWVMPPDTLALCIGKRPIAKPDTAESLLKALVDDFEKYKINGYVNPEVENRLLLHERAKAFLEKGEK